MKDLFTVLNEEELEQLDQFLLDRIDEDSDTEGKDEGTLDISELDGLFTAIVSGPVMVPPSQWLPAVWGDYEPVRASEKDFNTVLSLMMRHMNGIAAMLMEQPDDFEPMFLEREVEGKTYAIVDEWCEGYHKGVLLARDRWDAAGREMADLLSPILAFAEVTGWRAHELSEAETDAIRQAIIPNVREIHAFWLARREEPAATARPVRRNTPRVGRNDPCPCGSGKKYKKCCLH